MATRRPLSDPVDGSATDAVMAQRVVDGALCDEYRHVPALGWPTTAPVGVTSARRWWSRQCATEPGEGSSWSPSTSPTRTQRKTPPCGTASCTNPAYKRR